tara:strand:+ start:1380 stop:1556 length:177 start_codon:yes stop_codon:yes gene_type:complete
MNSLTFPPINLIELGSSVLVHPKGHETVVRDSNESEVRLGLGIVDQAPPEARTVAESH